MMYNEICQYSTVTTTDPLATSIYGTVPVSLSFPYSCLTRSQDRTGPIEQVFDEKLLDQCRAECSSESNKALALLSTSFDSSSSATKLLHSMIEKIQKGLESKSVV